MNIIGVAVPSGATRTIRTRPGKTDGSPPGMWAVAGPDQSGRVAFLELYFPKKSHSLKTIRLDGSSEQIVFTHEGDPMWQHAVGKSMSLSESGGRIALIGAGHGVQMPRALLDEGPLEVWDVGTKTFVARGQALDDGLAWFPGGQKLACVRLLPREKIAPPTSPPRDEFGQLWAKWDRVPAVCVVDAGTGKERVLAEGTSPVVADDGMTLLVSDFAAGAGTRWRRIDVATGNGTGVPEGLNRVYVALSGAGEVLYLDEETGGDAGKTKYYSPLAGARPLLALELGRLGRTTGTRIAGGFDPRHRMSFGRAIAATFEGQRQ